MLSDARPMPQALTISAADGFKLGATVFEPAAVSRPRATVIIHGATATPQTYYHAFAAHAAERGLRVITYDYRGIGASRTARLRGFPASMTTWAQLDARAVHAWARDQGGPVVIVGHSFGGQMIGLIDELRDAAAAVVVASSIAWYGYWPLPARLGLAVIWYGIVPMMTRIAGYLPGRAGLGVDLPAGVAAEWARWCRHREYLAGHHDDAAARFARWDRPTRFYSISDDDFAPRGAIDALIARLSASPLEHRRISPADLGVDHLGHFGFFRRHGAALWTDALDYVDAVLSGTQVSTAPVQALASETWITQRELEEDLAYGRP